MNEETLLTRPLGRALVVLSAIIRTGVFVTLIVGSAQGLFAQQDQLQGDPFKGRNLLKAKLCTQCHSVWGQGGVVGPDLSAAVVGKNWLELVGDFWNHTPRMIDAMSAKGYAWPTLDREEMANLLSYLYYMRLFDEPGDPERGSVVYFRLRCVSCHSIGGEGGSRGGPLDRFSSYPSTVKLAQAMWNSGPAMQQTQLGRGIEIPSFTRNEIAHIQAYIRTRALRQDRDIQLLPLPDPTRGAEVFRAKRCRACHQGQIGLGPDLRASALNLSVSEISGILWNHSYEMFDSMRSAGIAFPRFEENEMADLISYLQFLGFFAERGDPQEGAVVFRDRGCMSCHAGRDSSAIDLATSSAVSDPISLSSAMWNHAPDMHELMADLAIAWPKFHPGEMEDLAAYLNTLSERESKRE